MNTSIDNISFNISGDKPASSSFYETRIELSQNNTSHIYSILSYGNLQENWDSYGAKKPNGAAITKAINFIYSQLSTAKQEAFFTAPTPDGDVLVEINNAVSTLEFIFSGNQAVCIILWHWIMYHIYTIVNLISNYASINS